MNPMEGGQMMEGGQIAEEGGNMTPTEGGEMMGGTSDDNALVPVDLGMFDTPIPTQGTESSEVESVTTTGNEGCAQTGSSLPLTPEGCLVLLFLIAYRVRQQKEQF